MTLAAFAAEVSERHPEPGEDVVDLVILPDGAVLVAAPSGLWRLRGEEWERLDLPGPIAAVGAREDDGLAVADGLYAVGREGLRRLAELPEGLPQVRGLSVGKQVLIYGQRTLWALDETALVRLESPDLEDGDELVHVAQGPDGELAAATTAGLYRALPGGLWERVRPTDDDRGWDLREVRGVAYDADGGLWFSSPQGVGRRETGGRWRLYGPTDGLPWNGFSPGALATCEHGAWFGTDRGALHFTGERWAYRQGSRWLPADEVHAVANSAGCQPWFATSSGVGAIRRPSMTLAEKARRYEAAIDQRHTRPDWAFVDRVTLERPGRLDAWGRHNSDNDGLWTAMHGASACFAWASTGDELARERARRCFEALRFLTLVTQGGNPGAQPGFPARSVLPIDGPDPNLGDSVERDQVKQAERDRLWKVIQPRWPISADGNWYWKSDTSSDELDGHFFFYAQYYDLVADTEAERARVRETVTAIADHLLRNGLRLVDHDGKPTRWANYAPESLNHDPDWFEERGLNSLSILSYLKVAEHVSGDPRYRVAARRLIDTHGYAQNVLAAKVHQGPGTGNQSDDEMAFMAFYDLLLYEHDPALLRTYRTAFARYWQHVEPEGNPFFAIAYAASCAGERVSTPWGEEDLSPRGDWLERAVDALRRIPLDRVRWGSQNSHRLDVVQFAHQPGDVPRGRLRDGGALPLDERWVEHWNQDPWVLDYGYEGRVVGDGAVFLLPYYLGRYHGFLREP